MRKNRRIQGAFERCIYCASTQPRTKREHVLSQGLGTFEQNWTLDCVCDTCNKYFGDTLELPLGRDSLESLLRVQLGVKSADEVENILYRRLKLSLQTTGPFDGVTLRMAASDGAIGPDAPPQVALRATGGGWEFITEKHLTRERIEAVSRDLLEVRIFGRSGTDDTQRLLTRLKELGVSFQEASRLLGQPLVDGHSIPVVHDLNIDTTLQRAIAKISFNYLAYTLGADMARRAAFDTLRHFIRDGEAQHLLVTAQKASLLVGSAASDSHTHVCAIMWEPTRRALVGDVSLFNTLTYGVQLATSESDEWVTTVVAHSFDPITRAITELSAMR